MFTTGRPKTLIGSAFVTLTLIFEAAVREQRKGHSNALYGLLLNVATTIAFVLAFQFMFSVMGLKSVPLRGDFLLFMLSGVFLFLTHTKALGAVASAEGPTSAMMMHGPMNTVVSITGAALGSLYTQVLTIFLILFMYHVAVKPVVIEDPAAAFGMMLLAWFSGCAIGLVFMALSPWAPNAFGLIKTIYQRANMIASGKMFVANALPPTMLSMFSWNPLFHTIDQARGHVFINYFPHKTSALYPVYFSLTFLMLGLMIEFFTRRHASLSWKAGR
ncbi:ABC transporter permease [Brevirhabdus sp.]|uniref:ABC transporter permease n=1 Tax=Brevirhabdus sp. TaxID=2004514 RepID=UPI00405885AC